MPNPDDVFATSPEAIEVQAMDGTPYPVLTPEQLYDDIIDRVVVWVASLQAGTEDQLLMAAGQILHQMSLFCLNSVGHQHDEDGNPIGHTHGDD